MTLGRVSRNGNTTCLIFSIKRIYLALSPRGYYKRNMKFSDAIRPYKSADLTGFVRVIIAGQPIGWTRREFAVLADGFNDTWDFQDEALHLSNAYADYDARTQAIDETFVALSEAGHLPSMPDYGSLGGIDWYPIYSNGQANDRLAIIKRFYAPFLGIHNEAIMVHGFHDNRYWAAKRGKIVEYGAGLLDIMVAGAVRHDQNLEEAILDEGMAEANIDATWLPHIKPVQKLHFYYLTERGFLMNETFHIYDFDTHNTFEPKTNLPLEVEGFQEYSIPEIMIAVQHGNIFKGQINMVLADFLIRHGHLTAEHPDYQTTYDLLYQIREL